MQVTAQGNICRRLGFGVGGPHGTPLVRPEATIALVRYAYERGVRQFDTAPSYGAGEAERRLGYALAAIPDRGATVSTKAGVLSDGALNKRRDFSPKGVRLSVEASLARLRRSRLDVLYLHGPAPAELSDDLLSVLADLKAKGDVGALGVCGTGNELDAAIATGCFTHYMTPVHAGLTSAALQRIGRIRSSGTLIGIETMALTKKSTLPISAGGIWRLARAIKFKRSATLAPPVTVKDALRWSLRQGGADLVMTTTTRRRHLEQVVDFLCAGVALSEHSEQ